jgi:hypothetical protein
MTLFVRSTCAVLAVAFVLLLAHSPPTVADRNFYKIEITSSPTIATIHIEQAAISPEHPGAMQDFDGTANPDNLTRSYSSISVAPPTIIRRL